MLKRYYRSFLASREAGSPEITALPVAFRSKMALQDVASASGTKLKHFASNVPKLSWALLLGLISSALAQTQTGMSTARTADQSNSTSMTWVPDCPTVTPSAKVQTSIPSVTVASTRDCIPTPSPDSAANGAKPNAIDATGKTTPETPVKQLPPPEATDFQLLTRRTLGKELPIYGQALFQNPQTFAALTDVEATADYVISTGDEILVRVWGPVRIDTRLTVDRGGNIYIPQVGEVHVAGYRYGDLDAHIRSAIGQVFHDVNISVDLGHLRSIQIFVTGRAMRPGTYVVSSLSTLINAIFATGGPAPMGSFRHIQLRRNDKVVSELDLYDLILHGDKSKDVRLLPGDVVYIPPVGAQIAVGGSVKEPGIYELAQPATLNDGLQLAGGLVNTADDARASLERIVDHDHRQAQLLRLSLQGSFALQDGDLISVGSISPRFDETVTIRGNLLSPGRFAWHPGMKLSEIIPDKKSLLTPDYWETRNAEGTFVPFQRTTVSNGLIETAPASSTRVNLPAPEINWSYALIERTDTTTLRNQLIPFNLGKLVLNRDLSEDKDLLPGDVVTIFSQADIHVPVDQQTRFVRIEGEVAHAGFYPIETGDTLQSILIRAGGITSRAYLFGTQLVRPSERARQQQDLDDYIEKLAMESQRSAQNVALNNGSNAQNSIVALQTELIARLRAQRATGRVSLSIPVIATNIAEVPALPMEDGDTLTVPSVRSTVNVLGSVYNPSLYEYRDGASVKYYLAQAGDTDRDADPKHMFILRANGTVLSRQHVGVRFSSIHLAPGDTLVVPAMLYSISKFKNLLDVLTGLGPVGLLAAAVVR